MSNEKTEFAAQDENSLSGVVEAVGIASGNKMFSYRRETALQGAL